jgi:hypothetical protein
VSVQRCQSLSCCLQAAQYQDVRFLCLHKEEKKVFRIARQDKIKSSKGLLVCHFETYRSLYGLISDYHSIEFTYLLVTCRLRRLRPCGQFIVLNLAGLTIIFACVAKFYVSASLCLVALGVVDRWEVGPVGVEAVFEGIDSGGLDD